MASTVILNLLAYRCRFWSHNL